MNLLHALNRFLKPAKADLSREIIGPALAGLSHRYHVPVDQGLTLAQLAALLRDADYGYADAYLTLAEELEERSPHYASVLSTRKRAVLGLPRLVESASDKRQDKKLADAVRDALAGPSLNGLLSGLLDALGKGYSAVELLWDTSATPWIPRYAWRDPRFFRYDRETGNTLLLAPTVYDDGQPLPAYRFIVHQPQLKMGLPIRGGLARLCAVPHLCARMALEDWLLFAEVFGMPLRIGRYGSSASKEDVELLKAAVTGLGHDAAAVLHESMAIEFQSAASGAGGADLYERLLDRLDKLISKAVLGRSDAADATAGKLGGETQASEVRRDILESDAADLSETLNAQLVRPFIDLNFGPQQRYPTLKLHVPDQEDLAGLVDMVAKLVPLGLKVEQSVIRDKFGLPDPDEDAELLGAPAPPSPVIPALRLRSAQAHAGIQGSAALNAVLDPRLRGDDDGRAGDDERKSFVIPAHAGIQNTALNRATAPKGDPTAPLVERLGEQAEPLLNTLLDPVRAALDESADLMDFRAKLLQLYPEMDSKAFAELMGQALAVADAAGMWEAQ